MAGPRLLTVIQAKLVVSGFRKRLQKGGEASPGERRRVFAFGRGKGGRAAYVYPFFICFWARTQSKEEEGRGYTVSTTFSGLRSRLLRRLMSDRTRSLLKERVRCDLKRFKNRLLLPCENLVFRQDPNSFFFSFLVGGGVEGQNLGWLLSPIKNKWTKRFVFENPVF